MEMETGNGRYNGGFFNELVEEFLSCHNYTLSLTDELD